MLKIPYEVIEHRENVALVKDYSWQKALTYCLCLKSATSIAGIALSVAIYGLSPSWPRNIFFWRLQIVEAISWIPMMFFASMIEYVYTILRVHNKMSVRYVRKDRAYYRVEAK